MEALNDLEVIENRIKALMLQKKPVHLIISQLYEEGYAKEDVVESYCEQFNEVYVPSKLDGEKIQLESVPLNGTRIKMMSEQEKIGRLEQEMKKLKILEQGLTQDQIAWVNRDEIEEALKYKQQKRAQQLTFNGSATADIRKTGTGINETTQQLQSFLESEKQSPDKGYQEEDQHHTPGRKKDIAANEDDAMQRVIQSWRRVEFGNISQFATEERNGVSLAEIRDDEKIYETSKLSLTIFNKTYTSIMAKVFYFMELGVPWVEMQLLLEKQENISRSDIRDVLRSIKTHKPTIYQQYRQRMLLRSYYTYRAKLWQVNDQYNAHVSDRAARHPSIKENEEFHSHIATNSQQHEEPSSIQEKQQQTKPTEGPQSEPSTTNATAGKLKPVKMKPPMKTKIHEPAGSMVEQHPIEAPHRSDEQPSTTTPNPKQSAQHQPSTQPTHKKKKTTKKKGSPSSKRLKSESINLNQYSSIKELEGMVVYFKRRRRGKTISYELDTVGELYPYSNHFFLADDQVESLLQHDIPVVKAKVKRVRPESGARFGLAQGAKYACIDMEDILEAPEAQYPQ